MINDHSPNLHEDREALLTAYALEQLQGEERAAVEASLASDPAAQSFVRDTRRISALAKEALTSEAAPAASVALRNELEERLMVRAAIAKPLPARKRGWKVEIAIGTVAGGILASLLVPGLWNATGDPLAIRDAKEAEQPSKSTSWFSTDNVRYQDEPLNAAMNETREELGRQSASLSKRLDNSELEDRKLSGDVRSFASRVKGTSVNGHEANEPKPQSSSGGHGAPDSYDVAPPQAHQLGEAKPYYGRSDPKPDSTTRGSATVAKPTYPLAPAATPHPSDPVSGPPVKLAIVDNSRSMEYRYKESKNEIAEGVDQPTFGQFNRGVGVNSDQGVAAASRAERLREVRIARRELLEINRRSPGAVSETELKRLTDEERSLDLAPSSEQYEAIVENSFLSAKDHALSTFSIDVDTASYANTRRFLTEGQLPPPSAVRIEELINYFTYDDPQPAGNGPFSVNMELAQCPWTPGHHLLRVGLKGREIAKDKRPNSNLVFLLDVSGSMQTHNKLPLVKQAMQMLTRQLTENDMVTIVVYAGQEGLALDTTSGDQQDKILAAIDNLAAGGSTHASAGITLAYEKATQNFLKDGTNRVILCTDGDFNVGITDDEALVKLITDKAKSNVFLSVLGFGMGNLKDAKMEKLADKGNGNYGYIDTAKEAKKVLVEQMTGSLITIAKDVKIQVEFNPAKIASYRQIGYENRVLAAKDFDDDTKDAGEIGAGHSVTALYEVVLAGQEQPAAAPKEGDVPLKYQRPAERAEAKKPATDRELTEAAQSGELMTVKLRFKEPTGDKSELMEFPLKQEPKRFGEASENLRFASAVAAFGMVLRGSEHRGGATMSAVEEIASASLGKDPNGYRAEFLELVRKAAALGK